MWGSLERSDNGTLQWTGMIGMLSRGEADLAATSLTVTAERSGVVSFLPPFHQEPNGVMLHKSHGQLQTSSSSEVQLHKPLSPGVSSISVINV